jgi:hypothetical protein
MVIAVAMAGVVVVRAMQPTSGRWLEEGQRIVDGIVIVGEALCADVPNKDLDCFAIIGPALIAVAEREPEARVTSAALARLPRIWQAANGEKLLSHGTPFNVGYADVVLVTFADGHRRAIGVFCLGGGPPTTEAPASPAICHVDDAVLTTYRAS